MLCLPNLPSQSLFSTSGYTGIVPYSKVWYKRKKNGFYNRLSLEKIK
jgi:hypothetical protein